MFISNHPFDTQWNLKFSAWPCCGSYDVTIALTKQFVCFLIQIAQSCILYAGTGKLPVLKPRGEHSSKDAV